MEASSNSIRGIVKIVDREGNEIADRSNVVIFVDGLPDSGSIQPVPNEPQVSHEGRRFTPAVLPLVRGTTVDFYNDDDIFHNVFSLSVPKVFDLGIYPVGTSKLVTFHDTGVVKLHCNIHPQMTSTILVLNNDLFTRTDRDGNYQIENLPDGELTLRVWSEFSDEQERVITFSGSEHREESFVIHETKTFVQHRNKFGKRYREKY